MREERGLNRCILDLPREHEVLVRNGALARKFHIAPRRRGFRNIDFMLRALHARELRATRIE